MHAARGASRGRREPVGIAAVPLAPGERRHRANSHAGRGSTSGRNTRRTGLVASPSAISTEATITIGSHSHVGSRSRSTPDSRNGYSTNECSR